jgi:hypothetical protein
VYRDLSAHIGATLLPPLAILAGVAVGRAASGAPQLPRKHILLAPGLAAVCLSAWYATAVPAIWQRDQRLVAGQLSTDPDGPADEEAAVQLIGRMTDEDDFVVTDAPYLAFMANRLVPPRLVDPADERIRAGDLTDRSIADELDTYDPDLIVLWTGKLGRFPSIQQIVGEEFESVAEFGTVQKGLVRGVYRERAPDHPGQEVGDGGSNEDQDVD